MAGPEWMRTSMSEMKLETGERDRSGRASYTEGDGSGSEQTNDMTRILSCKTHSACFVGNEM